MKSGKCNLIIIEPEDIPADFDKEIDRGILEEFPLEFQGKTRKVWILYPENRDPLQKYPVLYLIHGQGSNAEWPNVGRIKHIIGNMVAQNKIPEMVVVMPDILMSGKPDFDYQLAAFMLKEKLIPYIEGNEKYHAMPGWKNRAIAGLSKGGLAVLYYAYQYYKKEGETFHYVGSFSPTSCLFSNTWIKDRNDFKLGNYKNSCVFIASGGHDIQIKVAAKEYCDELARNGTSNTYAILRHGEHDWNTFKRLLYVFLSYDFFRKNSPEEEK